MKKLLVAMLALTSFSVCASVLGTPDEDPIVANLRTRFEMGTEPNPDYLLRNTFKCKEMMARRGDFKKITTDQLLRLRPLMVF